MLFDDVACKFCLIIGGSGFIGHRGQGDTARLHSVLELQFVSIGKSATVVIADGNTFAVHVLALEGDGLEGCGATFPCEYGLKI